MLNCSKRGCATTGLFAVVQIIGSAACAAPVLWNDNGHYYEVVVGAMNWNQAKDSAAARTHLGATGHLVTVTSANENLFLTATFTGPVLDGKWLGGFQTPGSSEPAGGWTWITGEAFTFNGWFPGEPNNTGGIENAILFSHPVQAWGKGWNDGSVAGNGSGYVVEYEVPGPGGLGVIAIAAVLSARRRSRS